MSDSDWTRDVGGPDSALPRSTPDSKSDTSPPPTFVETLYRGLADNTVGKVIESLLRIDLIILDELGRLTCGVIAPSSRCDRREGDGAGLVFR
jgi:hypothetical protein